MAARVNYSVATLSAAASGRRLPTLEVTLAYVVACTFDVCRAVAELRQMTESVEGSMFLAW
jgi:hypothetical protein